jgi:uncharacterized protein YndB with AHSA1/START domain
METNNAMMLKVSKDFAVPADRLYRAWVSAEELKQWWHPMGNQLQQVTNELKEGGQIRYVFETSHGKHAFDITGQYKEVKEAARLVYSWNWNVPEQTVENSQFQLTIVFSNQGNGSRIEITQENFVSEEAIHPHHEGWEKALEDLKNYVEKAG